MPMIDQPTTTNLTALDRRSLLKGGILGSGLLAAPLSAQFGRRGFTHGVASGEPSQDSVLIWTRYGGEQDTPLGWQVMEADAGRRVVAEGSIVASPARDFCCKAVAKGLQPGRWYYYRFTAPDGAVSDEGRTRTLPEGGVDRFRMAVFSCSNIGFGWFNAYAHAAQADDVDLVVHTGDYFYEYPPGAYPSRQEAVAARLGFAPSQEAVSLADYRLRHASYRNDADLRRLHQLFPMIATWDDHESANDSYAAGAQNHQSDTEGDWGVRKRAAMQAYREWMPVSDAPWAAYELGDLATIFRLETRLTARDKQFDIGDIIRGNSTAEATREALTRFRDGDYRDPARHMLGSEQEAWLADGFKRSRSAGKTWQVLAQQVLMGQLSTPVALAQAIPADAPAFVRERVLAGALASSAGLPLNMDAWDGYPAARGRVFEAALAADANLISLAGDTHNAWAFELAHDGAPVGIEFGGHSVTSPGLEAYLGAVPPDVLAGALIGQNRQLAFTDTSQRGYMAVELTPQTASAEYRFMAGVRSRGAQLAGTRMLTSAAGSHKFAAG